MGKSQRAELRTKFYAGPSGPTVDPLTGCDIPQDKPLKEAKGFRKDEYEAIATKLIDHARGLGIYEVEIGLVLQIRVRPGDEYYKIGIRDKETGRKTQFTRRQYKMALRARHDWTFWHCAEE